MSKVCMLFVASHFILLMMMLFTLPVINNQVGVKAFDLQTFGYSLSTAELIVNNLNEETMQLYLFPQLTLLDLLYPVLVALFLSSLLFRLIKGESKLRSILLIVPFLAMFFDYAENICIILMISKSIELSEPLVLVSSTFTILKGTLTSIAWIAILAYAFKWLITRIKKG